MPTAPVLTYRFLMNADVLTAGPVSLFFWLVLDDDIDGGAAGRILTLTDAADGRFAIGDVR